MPGFVKYLKKIFGDGIYLCLENTWGHEIPVERMYLKTKNTLRRKIPGEGNTWKRKIPRKENTRG